MWLTLLQWAWSFIFYFFLLVTAITLIGGWKKFSQAKAQADKAYTSHLQSSAPPLPSSLWPRLPSTASVDSASFDTDTDEDLTPLPLRTERDREKEKEKDRDREKGRDRDRPLRSDAARAHRRGHDDDDGPPPVPLPTFPSRAPLSDDGLEGEEGSDREPAVDGSDDVDDSPHPDSPRSHSLSPLPPPFPRPLPPPVHPPSPDVVVYREFARVLRRLWLQGLLRQQAQSIERMMDRERERGKLPSVAYDALKGLTRWYTRRRPPQGEEGGGDATDDVDVYALIQRGAGEEEGDEAGDAMRGILAAVHTVAALTEEDADKEAEPQGEGEEEKEATVTGELIQRLQRLLSIPVPLPVPTPSQTQSRPPSPGLGAVRPVGLPPLPSVPAFDPYALTSAYLSDSHSVRTQLAQQMCSDRQEGWEAGEGKALAGAAAAGPSPFPVLRPVYTMAALQTRHLNVELMGEMELVLFRVQKRLETLMQDNLNQHLAAVAAQAKSPPLLPAGVPASVPPLPSGLAVPSAVVAASPASARTPGSAFSPGAPLPVLPVFPVTSTGVGRSMSSDTSHSSTAAPTPRVASPVMTRHRAASTTSLSGTIRGHSSMSPVEVKRALPLTPSTSAYTPGLVSPPLSSRPQLLRPSTSYHRSPSPATQQLPFTPHNTAAAIRTLPVSPFHATTPSLPPRPPSSGGSSPQGPVPRRVATEVGGAIAGRMKEVKQVTYVNGTTNGTSQLPQGGTEEDGGHPKLRQRGHHRSQSLALANRLSG